MVPTGTDAKCKGARPIVLYAHGTTTDIDYDLTNLENEDNAEGLFLAAYFAAQGYIVVAPNYAGYTGSTLGYHPYLNGDQQSKDMIDALKAARSALPSSAAQGTTDGGKLYVTGYSQGGYVALATERALEAAGTRVNAAAPMSGPYALSAFADAIFAGRVNGGAPIFTTMMLTAYQKSYGNVYGSVNDVYSPQYVDGIESLLPSTRLRSEIYDAGDLPPNALFNSVPPDPAYANITPATKPENLAPVFERGFDEEHLLKNSFRLTYLQDRDAHPDGWWPDPTTNEPPASPGMPFRQAIKRNDLRTWTPATPTLLCGGHDDPVVFWMNTEAMQDYWKTHGSATAPFTVLDVDAATSGNDDPYEDVKRGFSIAKDVLRATAVAQGATDGGDEAVFEAYHAGLVAPFCIEAARNFFEDH
nr:esterase [uncultured bacterium]